MMELLKAFKAHWQKKNFAQADQTILLAVSGGADSMVMADLMHRSGIAIAVAHCNFQLRGEEADKDEALVKQWTEEHNVPFHHIRFSTKEKSEEWKKGTQETARILRYEWLDMIRCEHKYMRIATAHHANDNVETLLMNLFKGTGINGLHAIPERNNFIIRPLLFAAKEDIRNYAKEQQVPFREDASNATDVYLRNAVRLNIIPVIEKHFPNVVQQVNESIERFAQAEELYDRAVEQERKKLMERRGRDCYVPIRKLKTRTPLDTICYELFKPFGFTPAQVPHIIDLMESGSGHYIASSTHRIIHNRNFLIVTALPAEHTDMIPIEGVPCTVDTDKYHFHFSIQDKPKSIPTESYTAYIDAHYATFPMLLRRWRQGDYFYPLGMGMKKKKLSRFLIDQKVPLHEKEHVWILECNKRIVWVAGMRPDERFKVKDSTQQVVKVTMTLR